MYLLAGNKTLNFQYSQTFVLPPIDFHSWHPVQKGSVGCWRPCDAVLGWEHGARTNLQRSEARSSILGICHFSHTIWDLHLAAGLSHPLQGNRRDNSDLEELWATISQVSACRSSNSRKFRSNLSLHRLSRACLSHNNSALECSQALQWEGHWDRSPDLGLRHLQDLALLCNSSSISSMGRALQPVCTRLRVWGGCKEAGLCPLAMAWRQHIRSSSSSLRGREAAGDPQPLPL